MGDDGVSVHICSKGCERPRSFGCKPHDSAVPAGEVSGVESPLLQIWTLGACGQSSAPLDSRLTPRLRGRPTYLGGRREAESAVLLVD